MRGPDTRYAHRRHQLQQALFRGHALTLNNPAYLRWVQVVTEELAQTDRGPGDLTVEALAVDRTAPGEACVLAAAPGVVAGLDEVRWFHTAHGLRARTLTVDGATLTLSVRPPAAAGVSIPRTRSVVQKHAAQIFMNYPPEVENGWPATG